MLLALARRSGARTRLAELVLPAIVLIVAGCSAAAGPSVAAPVPSPASPSSAGQAIGAPVGSLDTTISALPGSGLAGSVVTGSSGAAGGTVANGAIVYPYPGFAGITGVAPDHTIVVVGSGQAALKDDGSDRAAAERVALAAALVDARALADDAAAAAGVSISGVSSISVSVGESYFGVLPMNGVAQPNSLPGAPAIAVPSPAAPQLSVTVTVAYRID
jgi:Protein of unknown function (DUF541)